MKRYHSFKALVNRKNLFSSLKELQLLEKTAVPLPDFSPGDSRGIRVKALSRLHPKLSFFHQLFQ
jgi:hypothetical protein